MSSENNSVNSIVKRIYIAADVDKTLEALKAAGETAYVVGTCEAGEKGVTIC